MMKRNSRSAKSGSPLFNAKDLWHLPLPKAIANECRPGNGGDGWDAWIVHLEKRKKPQPLGQLFSGKQSPLAWSLPDRLDGSDTERLILALGSNRSAAKVARQEQLEPWLVEAADAAPNAAYALECLALVHALPSLARHVSPTLWWSLLEHLITTARSVGQYQPEDAPLTLQLLFGELPLALAYTFPEIKVCRRLLKPAYQELSEGPVQLLDGEGMPQSRHLHALRPLLACWTRCSAMGDSLEGGCWNEDAETQYQWLVRQSLRLTRADGSQAFSHGSVGRWCLDLYKAAMENGGDDDDWAAAEACLPNGSAFEDDTNADPPEPAENSEWSGVAVLRNNWSRRSKLLAVKYGERDLEIELSCGKNVLLSGTWAFDLDVNGRSLCATDDWEEICWVSDENVDYLELEISLTDGVRLQRQLLLSREDHFLYLADCVLGLPGRKGLSGGKAEYTSRLPLAADVEFRPAKETREGYLATDKNHALVMPLALPEWRLDPRYGSLEARGGELLLNQTTTGRNLCCPLFFDLDLRRIAKQRTWRQLTVAESLQIVAADVAVGYRIQCGKDQWLTYRSLDDPANRTLLGHNLSSDCEIGRITKEGDVEELLEIE